MSPKLTMLVCAGILAATAAVTALIFNTEPTAERSGATKRTAMLVDVTTVERDTYRPKIIATGTVRPVRDVVLSPRVAGEIVRQPDTFTPGTLVGAGETLIEIDAADYANAVRQRESALAQAEADLAIEQGRQKVAQQDWELLGADRSDIDPSLVLREPQLQAAQAAVQAARAALEQAQLDLERTRLRAPFDALVLDRTVTVGSQVAPGDSLGRLVGVAHYWVELALASDRLRWLAFPEPGGAGQDGAEVHLRNRAAWGEEAVRIGHLDQRIGALNDQTRLARILVSVPDPLARNDASQGPALTIGAFVEAEITGKPIADVIRLRREDVRQGDTAWVMDETQSLRIQPLDIVMRDAEHAYVRQGLEDGDRVVTSQLATATDGAALRTQTSATQ